MKSGPFRTRSTSGRYKDVETEQTIIPEGSGFSVYKPNFRQKRYQNVLDGTRNKNTNNTSNKKIRKYITYSYKRKNKLNKRCCMERSNILGTYTYVIG